MNALFPIKEGGSHVWPGTRLLAVLACLSWSLTALTSEPTVSIWPPGGTFTNFVGIDLFASNAIVRFTTDNREPDAQSPAFREPILITTNTVVKAKAFSNDKPIGPIRSEFYWIIDQGIEHFDSTLPLIVLDPGGMEIKGRDRIAAWLTVFATNQSRCGFQSPIDYAGRCDVAYRGSSSKARPKKPYRIELKDSFGEDLEAPLLGMPREADWILYPAFTDITMARDILAYELWRKMGYYSPRWRFVELFVKRSGPGRINPSSPDRQAARPASSDPGTLRAGAIGQAMPMMSDYQGIYILLEKIKRDKERLDIVKLKPHQIAEPEISGGYIFKKDRLNPGEKGFVSSHRVHFMFEEPKEEEIHPLQAQWLTNHVNRIEAALFGGRLTDPLEGYRRHIDVESFVDYHWMAELGRNFDGYWYSVFLHKDRQGKVRMGPLWDWDLSFGNVVTHGKFQVEGWRWDHLRDGFYDWYDRMFEDPDFLQRYIDRWSELRADLFATTNILSMVDELTGIAAEAQSRNYRRWPLLNPRLHSNRIIGSTFQDHVLWLKRWIAGRLAWIESQGFPAPQLTVVGNDSRIQLVGAAGTIYFTIDGSDPRLPGGGVSHAAQPFSRDFILSPSDVLFTRIKSPHGLWSAPLRIGGKEVSHAR